jgi:hypothetical protein
MAVDTTSHSPQTANAQAQARVAELADALDLGSSGATRPGSNPGSRTAKTYVKLLPSGDSYNRAPVPQ